MVTEPNSMEELVYYTQRSLGEKGEGNVKAWTYKEDCPKCGKAKMSKPRDEKTGKVKIRSKDYVCPACGYTVEKQAYEDTLTCQAKYTCPECKKSGEIEFPYKRKKVKIFDVETQKKKTVDALQFKCGYCQAKINITKKMK